MSLHICNYRSPRAHQVKFKENRELLFFLIAAQKSQNFDFFDFKSNFWRNAGNTFNRRMLIIFI